MMADESMRGWRVLATAVILPLLLTTPTPGQKVKLSPKGFSFEIMPKPDVPPGRSGTIVTRYPNGNKRSEYELVNGRGHGLCRQWWPNGRLRKEGRFVNGEPTGVWKSWYENGVKFWEGPLVNGKPEGVWTFWDEPGRKTSLWTTRTARCTAFSSTATPMGEEVRRAICSRSPRGPVALLGKGRFVGLRAPV